MSVKTEIKENKKEEIIDDISEHIIVSEPVEEEAVDNDKLAALKAKMSQKEGNKMPPRILEEIDRSLKLGIIGSGACGNRLAESMFSMGYSSIIVNTAIQDMKHIQVPEENKLFLEYGLGGASKDRSIGHEAAQMHKEALYSMVQDKLADCQVFMFCTSLGGGSGSGSVDTVIEVLSSIGKPIVVLTVLPMTSEDAQTKSNALEALSALSKKVQEKVIQNLIIADNSKIEAIFSDVGQMDFYGVSNKAIVEPLDVFNTYSAKSSQNNNLDSMDFLKIFIDGEGLSLYGCMPVHDYQEDTAIAEAIITNLDSGLLASGFDLKQTKYVGVIALANKDVWKKIPSSSINYAMSIVDETAGTPLGKFSGIYEENDIKEDVVKVYSLFSGLALPDPRVSELKKEVSAQKKVTKGKEQERNLNLSIDTGETETVTSVEKIKQKIEKKKSMFGKFTQGIVDKRKK